METFRHHPDNLIYIDEVEIPLDKFLEENPDYSLPEGFTGREYVKGGFHRVFNDKDEEFLDLKYDFGDKVIKDKAKYKKIKDKEEEDKIKQIKEKYDKEVKAIKEDFEDSEKGKKEDLIEGEAPTSEV